MDRTERQAFLCVAYALFWHLVFTGPIAGQYLRIVNYYTAGGPFAGFSTVLETIGTENVRAEKGR